MYIPPPPSIRQLLKLVCLSTAETEHCKSIAHSVAMTPVPDALRMNLEQMASYTTWGEVVLALAVMAIAIAWSILLALAHDLPRTIMLGWLIKEFVTIVQQGRAILTEWMMWCKRLYARIKHMRLP
jgi:hypothetical protein